MATTGAYPVQLIVGLGNPGSKYTRTRHNAGADFVAELAKSVACDLREESRFSGLTARTTINDHDIRLLIPTTFMNLSGKSVAAMASFFRIPVENILVAHDELDLDPGTARFKLGGGHGGHNGLRDIVSALGNHTTFARLRIGIGHPGHASQVTGYVLSKAPSDQQQQIDNAISAAIRTLPLAVAGNWQQAMTELHSQ